MRMIVIGDKRYPLRSGAYRRLVEFLLEPVANADGCHLMLTGTINERVRCPRTGRGRDAAAAAYELLADVDGETGVIVRCRTNRLCLNVEHMGFVPRQGQAHKAQPDDVACGAGHPWSAETIYEFETVRAGSKVTERQCKVCRTARKRAARARERRWRAMGWTPG